MGSELLYILSKMERLHWTIYGLWAGSIQRVRTRNRKTEKTNLQNIPGNLPQSCIGWKYNQNSLSWCLLRSEIRIKPPSTSIYSCCCCSHVSIVANGHGEFEVLLTPTEWVKVHAPQKFLQLSVDPHTSWNLLNYYLTLAIEYWQVCTLCHST